MKKEYIFLALSIVLPVVFIFSLWGYYGYYSSKINPQYDFVYASPYQGSYYDNSYQKQDTYNPFDIQTSGKIILKECKASEQSSPAFDPSNPNLIPVSYNPSPTADTICSSIKPKNLTYYRFNIKNKSSKQLSLDEILSLSYTTGKESPDGYTFEGDITTQFKVNGSFSSNIFYASSANNYDNATLVSKSGASVSLKLNDSIYNRLFIGYIKQ